LVDDLDELLLDDFSVELDVCFVVLIVVVVVSLCVDVEVDVEVAFFVEVDVLDDLKVDFTEDVDLTEDLEVDLLDAAEPLVFELDLVDDVERLLVFVLDEVFVLVLVTGGSRKSTRSYSVLVLEQLK
jgi:hypothetical protein